MALEGILSQKKAAILQKWLHLILETYPAGTSKLSTQERDRFINPVAYTFRQEMDALYQELLQGLNSDRRFSSLDDIIRIRAVQEFSPSQAVAFVFLLKRAVGEELERELRQSRLLEEWLTFQSRIDELALCAFDSYMKCRETIHEIRVNELRTERDRASTLLARMGLMEVNKEQE